MNEIETCTKRDFDQILEEFDRFWTDDATRERHHPMFVKEFGSSAWTIRSEAQVIAYLFGFIAQPADAVPYAYVHMVAVDRNHRRAGLAHRLYEHFIESARAQGCRRLKATAAPENRASIAFHTALGMTMEGPVPNYGGPGIDRVVFSMKI